MKKASVCLMAAFLCAGFLSAQGAKETSPEAAQGGTAISGKLIVASNCGDKVLDGMNELVDKFMKEYPGVKVEYSSYGKDYENLMKAKMAANDLPDVFATHGWGVNRYAEYLRPLNDLSFASRFTDSIRSVITTKDGNIVTMPVTTDFRGVLANTKIMEQAGWKTPPKTWKEFLQCCEDVKKLGVTPVYLTGKDNRAMAQIMDVTAPGILVMDKDHDYSQSLFDGSFDWSKWADVCHVLTDLHDKGYFNEDCNTADKIYTSEKLANGEVCFSFEGASYLEGAWELNNDAPLSVIPMPAFYDTASPYIIGGERESYGIWKDTKHMDAAIAFMEFLARPENIQYICEQSGTPSAFVGVSPNLRLAPVYTAYQNLPIISVFDRVWLPSGMWATMRTTGAGLTSREMSVEQACEQMKSAYLKLLSQKK